MVRSPLFVDFFHECLLYHLLFDLLLFFIFWVALKVVLDLVKINLGREEKLLFFKAMPLEKIDLLFKKGLLDRKAFHFSERPVLRFRRKDGTSASFFPSLSTGLD